MKMGYIALALIILISSLLIMFNNYLEDSVNDITKDIETMNYKIQNKDYSSAYQLFSDMKSKWEKSEKIIHLMIENEELDNISITIHEIESFFENNVFEEFLKKSYNLIFSINHLYEKNKLSLETIF